MRNNDPTRLEYRRSAACSLRSKGISHTTRDQPSTMTLIEKESESSELDMDY